MPILLVRQAKKIFISIKKRLAEVVRPTFVERSSGGRSGMINVYAIIGHLHKTSVPTAFTASGDTWTAAGDDQSRDAAIL